MTNSLVNLKRKLPPGYAKILAERLGLSPSTIRAVLRGDRYNLEVLKEAKILMEEHQSVILELEQAFNA